MLALEGDARIDAIFNVHRHVPYACVEDNTAVIQSGGESPHVVEGSFSWEEYGLAGVNARNHTEYETPELTEAHPDVKTIIDHYNEETDELLSTTIIENDDSYSDREFSVWVADLMRHATGADIGFQNN